MVYASRDVRLLGRTGKVRIKAAFGPFSLPDKSPDDPLWDLREDGVPRDMELRELLRQEREELEIHAKADGCRMILAENPLNAKGHSKPATAARLRILLKYLKRASDAVEVAFLPCGADGRWTPTWRPSAIG